MRPLSHFVHLAWLRARALTAQLEQLAPRDRAALIAYETWHAAALDTTPPPPASSSFRVVVAVTECGSYEEARELIDDANDTERNP